MSSMELSLPLLLHSLHLQTSPLLVGHSEQCLSEDFQVAMSVEWWLTLFLVSPETLLLGEAFAHVLNVVPFS